MEAEQSEFEDDGTGAFECYVLSFGMLNVQRKGNGSMTDFTCVLTGNYHQATTTEDLMEHAAFEDPGGSDGEDLISGTERLLRGESGGFYLGSLSRWCGATKPHRP